VLVLASASLATGPASAPDSAGISTSTLPAETAKAPAKDLSAPDSSRMADRKDTGGVRCAIPWPWIAGGAVVVLETTAVVVLVLQRLGVGVAPNPPPNQVIVSW
jgi:hypothetical protein